MFNISRSLTPAVALVAVIAATSVAEAQFFFFNNPPRKARQAPPREAPVPPQALVPAPFAEKATFNDTARFLAGLPPAEDSPLERITRDPAWQAHAASFNNSWRQLEGQRLSKIRVWSAANIKDRAGMPMYYMFSGPDFLYANAFYPNASTYILSGLEPVGPLPDPR